METWEHYRNLTAALGPARVGWALVRRARRAARLAAYRPNGWNPESVSAAPGLLEPLAAARLLEPGSALAWCDPRLAASVRAAVGALPGARSRALALAEAAAARSFNVFGTTVAFGSGGSIDWTLDRVRPATAAPAGDVKLAWALGRLDSLVSLARGTWLERSPSRRGRFVAELVAQTSDFLQANPRAVGVHWASPMEVALRAANLAQSVAMLRDEALVRSPPFSFAVAAALIEHSEHVAAHLEDGGAVPNNHLVAGYAGLLVVSSLFPRLPGADRWARLGARGLKDEIAEQVHPDGCSFEGSVAYHRLAVELFTLGLLAARARGVALGPTYVSRLRRMYRVAADYCSERGMAPQLGDNDSGLALPPAGRQSLDQGYLAPLGAALFGDSGLKRAGDRAPDEVAWLLGGEGLRRFARTRAGWKGRPLVSALGGLHVLRGAGATLAVSAGAPGQRGVGGHSHNDRLSFELHVRGVPLIVDPGTATYAGGLRDAFRATAAHNTLQVDGREQAPLRPGRPFALPGPSCYVHSRQLGRGFAELVAGYTSGTVEVRRTFRLDSARAALVVQDVVLGRGSRELVSRLHVRAAGARVRGLRPEELARASALGSPWTGLGPRVAELGPRQAPSAVVLFPAALAVGLEPALYSPGYAELEPALCVEAVVRATLPATVGFLVLLLPDSGTAQETDEEERRRGTP